MIMKTLTINGKTFTVVDADAMKKIADSELNMNGHYMFNAERVDLCHNELGIVTGVYIAPNTSIRDDNGNIKAGILEFNESDTDRPVILRNIADGQEDNDAATVGQLNAAVGDIETALDRIIAIQESLIGGAV